MAAFAPVLRFSDNLMERQKKELCIPHLLIREEHSGSPPADLSLHFFGQNGLFVDSSTPLKIFMVYTLCLEKSLSSLILLTPRAENYCGTVRSLVEQGDLFKRQPMMPSFILSVTQSKDSMSEESFSREQVPAQFAA